MKTPIADFVGRYRESGSIRFHMPGHKGIPCLGCESLDITEIAGADALYEAGGIIRESEECATALFGFGQTFYSAGGSSQCIKAMLYLTMLYQTGRDRSSRCVIAARNAHVSFIHACALLDLLPEWIYPGDEGVVLPGAVGHMISRMPERPLAVYITAPDYFGRSPDIGKIAAVCEKYDVPLLVDNAHGAYLKFLPKSRHPVDLGAFMSADSAHKTLPVLTGGAYLQLSKKVPEQITAAAKGALALFGSTSPSYLILQSLDLCNRYIADGYGERLAGFIGEVENTKARLESMGWRVTPTDPLRIVIDTAPSGYTGAGVAARLREQGIEPEFAGPYEVVLMVTPENTSGELDRLCSAMARLPRLAPIKRSKPDFPHNRRVMSPREAFLAPRERIPAGSAAGRVCASPVILCPPAVPVAVSGELMDEVCVALFEEYGIRAVEAVMCG